MARRRKSFPPIPRSLPQDAQALLRALVEVSEVGDGVRGEWQDRKVTMGDLVDGGIAKRRDGARPGGSGGRDLEANQPPPDMTVPPIPRGFYAVGSFWGCVDLSWSLPDDLYRNHGYTNIYRAETDNLANAVLIGREVGMFYTDTLRNDTVTDDEHNKGAYYWIRFVSAAGIEGPANDTAGTYAAPVMDLGVLLDTLSGSLNETQLSKDLNSRIDLIDGDMPGSVSARISTESTARQEADQAIARDVTQLSSSLGQKVATVEQSIQTTADSINGRLNAMYTLRTDVNGHVAGFGLSNDGKTSNFIVQADRFAVANGNNERYPFMVQNGNAYLDTAFIRDGTIQQGKLGAISSGKIIGNDGNPITTVGGLLRGDQVDANSLSVAKASTFTGTAQSANYSGTQGWRLSPTGAAVFGNGTIIQGDAEFRSGNVGDDVMIANTDSMLLIRQRAYAGSQAKDRADQWTRPGTTNINGNQIYTGDAYVDTLQIKGRAVTVANQYSRISKFQPTGSTLYSFEEIGHVYCDPDGGTITVNASLTAWIRSITQFRSVDLRLRIGNDDIDFENAIIAYADSSDELPFSRSVSFSSGEKSGNTRVTLYARSSSTSTVSNVFISAQGYKR